MNVAPPPSNCIIGLMGRSTDPAGSVLERRPIGGRGTGLVLGQPVDEVVHDHVGQLHVLPRGVIEMVAADRKTVAIATEDKDMQVGPAQRESGREREGAAMNEMNPVGVDEVGEAARTTNPCHTNNLSRAEAVAFEPR